MKRQRDSLDDDVIDFESNPFDLLARDPLATENILPTGGYDPYVPFVFDENNIVHDSRTPAERARARREGRTGDAQDGFSEPAATSQEETKPVTLPNGQPKKTTPELLNIIKANPTALKLEDIDFSDPAQVDAVIAAHRDTPGSLITVLRLCQNIVGYFPPDLIAHIAGGMNLPLS